MSTNHVDTPQLFPREGPAWLEKFLMATYFNPCQEHKFNKNERNHFCIDCIEGPLCARGLLSHSNHRTLQVRKASHADGVRVENVCKLLDISGIQTYIINNHRIVFLLRLAKGKLVGKGGTSRSCQTCGRVLNDHPMRFCSIKCKLQAVRDGIGGCSLTLTPETKTNLLTGRGLNFSFNGQAHAQAGTRFETISSARVQINGGNGTFTCDPHPRDNMTHAGMQKRKFEQMALEDARLDSLDHPLLSPVSVLQALRPSMGYALDHLGQNKSLATVASTKDLVKALKSQSGHLEGFCFEGSSNAQPSQTTIDDYRDELEDQEDMRMEVELIRRMLLASHRRKSRKGLPHRAPLY